jgi:hypothetical protein
VHLAAQVVTNTEDADAAMPCAASIVFAKKRYGALCFVNIWRKAS